MWMEDKSAKTSTAAESTERVGNFLMRGAMRIDPTHCIAPRRKTQVSYEQRRDEDDLPVRAGKNANLLESCRAETFVGQRDEATIEPADLYENRIISFVERTRHSVIIYRQISMTADNRRTHRAQILHKPNYQ